MDTNAVLNALVSALLPTLNSALPQYIKNAGLDPWKDVVSDKKTLGKINLGICKASAKASYSIKDMTGLSSLVILQMAVATVDASQLPTVTGTLSMDAKLNSNLAAKVSGKITAGCGGINESVSISGKVTASGVRGTGKVEYVATIATPQSCFTRMQVNNLSLNYDHIKVELKGLGIFNSFMDPLVDVIDALFGDAIKGEISKALQPVLNDLIKSELPFCIPVSE